MAINATTLILHCEERLLNFHPYLKEIRYSFEPMEHDMPLALLLRPTKITSCRFCSLATSRYYYDIFRPFSYNTSQRAPVAAILSKDGNAIYYYFAIGSGTHSCILHSLKVIDAGYDYRIATQSTSSAISKPMDFLFWDGDGEHFTTRKYWDSPPFLYNCESLV